ncbi:YlmC/YmxH family sporulation protein [Hominifimenecus sp. rT4P-3]|uniref:YlmC/YmxH family sporulation protein n=1 Tax=Hominifimenecus sp. rT4P-3 TaxID=3242979 RepID=UPI003DA3A4F2
MRICDLQEKEVINVCDCRRLGFVADLDFDICNGQILALIVPGPAQFCGFLGRDSEFVIPFCQVRQIGEDIILVDIKVDECQVRR